MSGQIVDAMLVVAPRQRNTEPEKAAIRAGKTVGEIWPDKPARVRQKDIDARWTMEFSKAKPAADGSRKSTSPSRASATSRTSRSTGGTGS